MAESRQSPNGWLRKAQTDLGAAQELHGRAEYSAIVCFPAHQAAEKALKAVAALLGESDIPRTHDLLLLAKKIADRGGELPVSKLGLAALGPYAVHARYDDVELTEVQTDEALRIARQLVQWAKQLIT